MFSAWLARLRAAARRRGMPHIDAPPPGVELRSVRPYGSAPVTAVLAAEDGVIRAPEGDLAYRKGEHYIVRQEDGEETPVMRRVFERTYRSRFDGLYEKRKDVVVHYFTLSYDVVVETLEGGRIARAGDWIMRGVLGELYPMDASAGRAKYEAI
jgi:hypothetical protein